MPTVSISPISKFNTGQYQTYQNFFPLPSLLAEISTVPKVPGLGDNTTSVSQRNVPAYSPPLDS